MSEMSELHAFQCDVAAALHDVTQTPAARRWLAGDAALVERRLAIYRANRVAAADKALSATYPVVRRVVGAELFHGLARAYQRLHPSTSGDLGDFGVAFPDFLAGFEHTRSLPYLPDLAWLEQAVQQAHDAADDPPWDAASLRTVDAADQASIRFEWTAGTAVLSSDRPVVRIWTLHRADHQGGTVHGTDHNVDSGADGHRHALVAREGYAVNVTELDAAQAAFMRSSLAGAALGDATSAALRLAPDFDLGGLLARAITAKSIRGFTLVA